MSRKSLLPSITGLLLVAVPAFGQGYTYQPFDVRCDVGATTCPLGLAPGAVAKQTSARGINARGDVVGFYVDTGNKQHGFLMQGGMFTTIDVPGVRATIANGLNAQGEIVGQYWLPVNSGVPEDSPLHCPPDLAPNTPDPACIKGFLYRRGTYTTVMFAGHPGAIAQRITSDGDIYGCLHDHDLGPSMFGAAWRRSLGAKDSVIIQDAFSLQGNGGELSDPMAVPMSMNNGATPGAQTIAGFFVDMANRQHAYLVQNATLVTYDPTPDTNFSGIWDINADQAFVGPYRKTGEPASKRHGYMQTADGSAPVTLDVTLTDATGHMVTAFSTTAFGINPSGVIVGQYVLVAGGTPHGFVALPPGK